jgi:ligand-binding sensor domain-containing protein
MLKKKYLPVALLLFLQIAGNTILAATPLNFFQLSRVDGLSNNNVNTIIQDSNGYLWFGTQNGLNRYNGYEFTNYFYLRSDSTTIPHNHVSTLTVDTYGRLWVGCLPGGLARYDHSADNFIRYTLALVDEGSVVVGLYDLAVDAHGYLWAATSHGLFLYLENADKFERIPDINAGVSVSLSSEGISGLRASEKEVQGIAADDIGGMWIIYSDWELSYLDAAKGTSRHYPGLSSLKPFPEITVYDIIHSEGKLYVATENKGILVYDTGSGDYNELFEENIMSTATDLFKFENTIWITGWRGVIGYNTETGEYNQYETDPTNPKSITSGALASVYADKSGVLWAGTSGSGINYAIINLPFQNFHNNIEDISKLYHPDVSAMLYDSEGNFWVAFQSGLIQMYPAGSDMRQMVPVDPRIPGAGTGHIFSILETTCGNIFISSWQGGLHKFDKSKRRFVNIFESYEEYAEKIGGLNIRSITEDGSGGLWIAVPGRGAVRYEIATGSVGYAKSKNGMPSGLSNDYTSDIQFDSDGNLWVSTAWGLNRLPPGDSVFITYFSSDEPASIVDNHIRSSFTDSEGRIWFVSNGGLSLYNPEEDNFVNFRNEYFGFTDLIIRSIEDDGSGNLWMSTTRGILKAELDFDGSYSPRLTDIFIYDVNHGILSPDFFPRSSLVCPDGNILFGGTRGIDMFDPSAVRYVYNPESIQIEKIRISDKRVFPGSPGGPPVNDKGVMLLSHKENMISFEFVALNYVESTRNRYYYKLEPFNDDWVYAGFDRNVNFINLPPGEYTFFVRACLGSGLCESEGASFRFSIMPPFWHTPWFIGTLLAGIIFLITGGGYAWANNIRKKRVLLEKLVQQRTLELRELNNELTEKSDNLADANKRLSLLNSTKDKFFSIIAHDLRNPLSTLSGFSDIILNRYEKYDDVKKKQMISAINETVNNTVQLLDNLLQWAGTQTNY